MERDEILAIYEAGPDAVINLIVQQAATITKLKERIKSLQERLNKNSRNSSFEKRGYKLERNTGKWD